MKSDSKFFFFVLFAIASICSAQQPPFSWAKKFDGSAQIVDVKDVEVDKTGNIFVLGNYLDTVDFDPGIGTVKLFANVRQPFLLKLTAAGDLWWVRDFGLQLGVHTMTAEELLLDSMANLYVAGSFKGVIDFDPGPGTYTMSSNQNDGFLMRIDSSGNFQWAKEFNGGGVVVNELDIDAQQFIYISGNYANTVDFDPGAATKILTTPSTNANGFVLKLTSLGVFKWVRSFESSTGSNLTCVACDTRGKVLCGGIASGPTDLNPGLTVSTMTNSGGFIVQLDSAGQYDQSASFYGSGFIYSLLTHSGVIASGGYDAPIDLDPGVGVLNKTPFPNSTESFVLKLDTNFALVWANTIQTNTVSSISNTKLKIFGPNSFNLFAAFHGKFDFDCGSGTFLLSQHPLNSSFNQSKEFAGINYDLNGNFNWGYSFGCGFFSNIPVAVSANAHIIMGGGFVSEVDFDPSLSTDYTMAPIPTDRWIGFVSKLASCSNTGYVGLSAYPPVPCVGEEVYLLASGAVSYYWQYGWPAQNPILIPAILTSQSFTVTGFLGDGCFEKASITIIPSQCLGINDLTNETNGRGYPNPVIEQYTIDSRNGDTLKIYNADGQEIVNQKIKSEITTISLSCLTPGVYIVRIYSHSKLIRTERLVKQ